MTLLPSGLRLVGTLNLVVGGGATQEESGYAYDCFRLGWIGKVFQAIHS